MIPEAPRPDAGKEDEDPWSTPAERARRRERTLLYRHQILFMLGILLGMIGAFTAAASLYAGAALFVASAACWFGSGLYAIAGGRHMFGSIGPPMAGNTWAKPSGRAPVASKVVGIVLVLLSLGLVNVAVNLVLAAVRPPPTEAPRR